MDTVFKFLFEFLGQFFGSLWSIITGLFGGVGNNADDTKELVENICIKNDTNNEQEDLSWLDQL